MTRARNAWVLAVIAVVVTIVATMDTGRAQSGYSTYSIRGTYRISFTGISLGDSLLESGIGIFVADGVGGITGTEFINRAAGFCSDVKVSGTYRVDGNGFGTMSGAFTSPAPGCSGNFTLALLVHEGGNLVKAVSTGSGFVVLSEEWRRE